jgi:putative endonuclease
MAQAMNVRRGRRNHLAGLCAEDGVERLYRAAGAEVIGRRVRTPGGELDIVARHDDILVFVEVKRRARLSSCDPVVNERQWRRLEMAATHYMMTSVEMTGAIRGCRFDVAIVGHDGTARLVQNARSFDGN